MFKNLEMAIIINCLYKLINYMKVCLILWLICYICNNEVIANINYLYWFDRDIKGSEEIKLMEVFLLAKRLIWVELYG
jgi:hypothetical protein